MSTPSLTPAMIVAIVESVLAAVVAFGLDLTEAQSGALIGLAGVLAAVLIGADAGIRRERARNAVQIARTKKEE